jgi:hypothetical protein
VSISVFCYVQLYPVLKKPNQKHITLNWVVSIMLLITQTVRNRLMIFLCYVIEDRQKTFPILAVNLHSMAIQAHHQKEHIR